MFGGQHISIDLINGKNLFSLLNYTLIPTNVPQKVRFAIYYEWEKGPNSLENSQNSEFKSNLGPDMFFWLMIKLKTLVILKVNY